METWTPEVGKQYRLRVRGEDMRCEEQPIFFSAHDYRTHMASCHQERANA